MTNLDTTEWPTATVRYRLNLPRTLHSISPALSALHLSRAAALHPEVAAVSSSSHCPKCGAYRFAGDHSMHIAGPPAKKKRRRTMATSQTKARHGTCHVCGFPIDACASHSSVPVPSPDNSTKTSTTRTEETQGSSSAVVLCTRTPLTTAHLPIPPSAARQSRPKSSHTKASTLKNMLSRDRQREVLEAQKKREGHGLAAFLKDL